MAETVYAASQIRHSAMFAATAPAIYYDSLQPDPPAGKPTLKVVK